MIIAALILLFFGFAFYAIDYDLRCLRDQIEEEERGDYELLNRLIDDLSPARRTER